MLAEEWPSHLCTRVHVRPQSEDDWEIVEDNAGLLEDQLLSQAKVVWTGQTLPVWISSSTTLTLVVCKYQ